MAINAASAHRQVWLLPGLQTQKDAPGRRTGSPRSTGSSVSSGSPATPARSAPVVCGRTEGPPGLRAGAAASHRTSGYTASARIARFVGGEIRNPMKSLDSSPETHTGTGLAWSRGRELPPSCPERTADAHGNCVCALFG